MDSTINSCDVKRMLTNLYGRNNVQKIEVVTLYDCDELLNNKDGSIVYFGAFNNDCYIYHNKIGFQQLAAVNQSIHFTNLQEAVIGLQFTGFKVFLKTALFKVKDIIIVNVTYSGVNVTEEGGQVALRLFANGYFTEVYILSINGVIIFENVLHRGAITLQYSAASSTAPFNTAAIYFLETQSANLDAYKGGEIIASGDMNDV